MAAIIGIFAGFWIFTMLLTIVLVAPFYIPVEGKDIINKFWNANKGLLIGIFSIILILKLFVKRLRNNRFVKVVLAGALALVISILPYVLGVYVAKNADNLFQKIYTCIRNV